MSNGKVKSAGAVQPAAAVPPARPVAPAAHVPPLFRPIDWLTFGITALLVGIGYYLTLAPDLTLEDSGELAVASFYAGIPHPPGYPVWTIYTWLWATLLPFSNIAWRVALGEGTAGALACGLLGFLVSRGSSMMIEGIADLKDISRRWESVICVVSGFVAGMLLGFNGYMWSQSVIVEVYAFSVLSLMGVLLGLLRWTYAPHQYRYLYLAFFMYGICFNNHQSLLVIALAMVVLLLVVQPKLAREFFFWMSIAYVGGLVLGSMGYISVLTSNVPVFVIYNTLGLTFAALWFWLVIKTKKRMVEIGRDFALVGSIGYLGLLFGIITSYVTTFEDSRPGLIFVHLLGIGCIAAFVRLYQATKQMTREWVATLTSAGAWIVGAAFYFYMPLAGMTNPPMQWGYPRTVEGFFHALTRGQYERIHPTSGAGDNALQILVNFTTTFAKQISMFLEGLNDEFNWVYLVIALVMFLYYRRMQSRERAWTVGVTAFFIVLGPFLVLLLNPPPDRAARELIRVFFTASHVLVAMGVGYGLTLIAATMATHYEKARRVALLGGIVALDFALFLLVVGTQSLLGEAHGEESASLHGFLRFVFMLVPGASIVLLAFRLFFRPAEASRDSHALIALGGIVLGSLLCCVQAFAPAVSGIEQSSLTGFAKILCWLLAAVCLYLITRPERLGDHMILTIVGGLSALLSLGLTATTLLADKPGLNGLKLFFGALEKAFRPDQYALPVIAGLILLGMTAVFLAAVWVCRSRAPMSLILALFAAMPMYSVLTHWFENEQHEHLFGYWFGHDMFTPPFTGPDGKFGCYDAKQRAEMMKDPQKAKFIYPEMTRDAVLYGGTDPGRFCPTYMIFDESFIPPRCKPHDPNYDRRDVYIITQNALADGTYLNYIRAHYNRSTQIDPPFFQELLRGPQERDLNYTTNFLARTAFDLLDRPFLALGRNIEKDRRVGSSFFKESDFTDLPGFAAKLRSGGEPAALSKYLFENLSQPTRDLLNAKGDESQLRRELAKDLNVLLGRELANRDRITALAGERAEFTAKLDQGSDSEKVKQRVVEVEKEITDLEKIGPMFTAERFKGVQISERTREFIAQDPESFTRIRLNRILLEEAYPHEIAVSAGGVYPDMEMYIATPDDSQRCFQEYLADAQRRVQHDRDFPNEMRQIKPGEDVRIIENRVQVSGQVAVMAINGLITKVMFDHNPKNEFFVEESFPLDWMYPHLTPFGVIMKINREPLPTLSDEILQRDHEFWSKYSERLIGNWITYDTSVQEIADFVEKVYLQHDFSDFKGDRKFVRDDQAQKAFSKLRSSIGGVYAWRLSAMALTKDGDYRAKTKEEFDKLFKEADFTFRQAFAFCPYSPEAVFRYVQLLTQPQVNRIKDARIVAETCLKLDPYNGQVIGLVNNLRGAEERSGEIDKIRVSFQKMEDTVRKNPTNFQAAFDLASAYLSMQQTNRAVAVLERMIKETNVDPNAVLATAKIFVEMSNWPKLEMTLERLVKVMPEQPETWYDLAALKSSLGKNSEALPALAHALELNAKRLQTNPAASNLVVTLRSDLRFNPLRQMPEFQKLVPPK